MSFQRFGTRQILAKLETTEGVNAVPTGLLNALMSFEGDLELDVDTAKRTPDLPWFTADDEIETGTRAKITFMADLLGSDTAGDAAPISPILQGCGFAETLVATTSATYNTITNTIKSLTLFFYQGGLIWKCFGSRADLTCDRSPSDFGKVQYTFTGIVDESDLVDIASIPTIDITAFRDAPVIVPDNWEVSVNGFNVECVKNSLKLGNSVNYIPTSESGRVLLTDRQPSGTLSILLPQTSDLGTFNPWTLAQARTRVPIIDTVDGGATMKSVITMGNALLKKPKKFVNIKGGIQLDIPYIPYPSGSGNDEVVIEFT